MSNNISLNDVKNAAFLANETYKKIGDKKSALPKDGIITNPATNSSFEVYNQAGNDSSGFSATVFKDISTGEYVIAFRGTEIGNGKISA